MILKNNSEKVINLVRYFETLSIENKLKISILVLKSDLIKFKLNKEKIIEVLEKSLHDINKSYNKDKLIFFKDNMDVFVLAMVMEMNEKQQKNFIFEMMVNIYILEFLKIFNNKSFKDIFRDIN